MTAPFLFEVRRAGPADVNAIAAAHLDSINSIGPQYYPPDIVADWGAQITGSFYLPAMLGGETFFIAIGALDGAPAVLGFSSHRIDGKEHGVSVYVRGSAARRGVGSALYRAAEASAIAARASSVRVDASLAAIEFYTVHGFEEEGRRALPLPSGRTMPSVQMRKRLAGQSPPDAA